MHNGIIDVHSHPLLPAWRQALAAATGQKLETLSVFGLPAPDWSAEIQLDMMDRHDITTSLLSLPGVASLAAGQQATALCRSLNESFATLIADHPGRFGAFATVPLDDMKAAVSTTAEALDVLKLHGVGIGTHHLGRYLGDPHFDPLLEELDRRSAVLFVHPIPPPGFALQPGALDVSILEFMFDTTRMVTNMILWGAKQRFPNIKVISTHGGGTIPYLASRLSIMEPLFGAGMGRPTLDEEAVMAALRTFYFDLTASTSAASLDALLHLVPAQQLLLGFDCPMMPAKTVAPVLARFHAYERLTADEKQMIMSGNALKLFPGLRSIAHRVR